MATAQFVLADTPDATLLERANIEMATGDAKSAATDYGVYLVNNPSDADAWLQLSRADAVLGDQVKSTADFCRYLAAAPEEQPTAAPYRRGNISGYVEHDSHYSDTFYGADVSYDLATTKLTPYIILHDTADTRSGAGISQIFSDNAVVLNFALRTGLGSHGLAFAEAGNAFGLRGSPSASDFRGGLVYFNEFGSSKTGHTVANGSLVEYSRFAGNVILYGSLVHDFPLLRQLRGVVGSTLGADAHRDYFNNFGEIFGGVQYSSHGVTIRYVRLYGTYLNRGVDRPDPIDYSSTRPALLFGFPF
ncbi:MAG: hypothetical protein M3160_04265 [Candidatus Eremiobacteraeota bacterium]|nr:hypothetical protein [Candidatus Eremiobacteraeota bacterium]